MEQHPDSPEARTASHSAADADPNPLPQPERPLAVRADAPAQPPALPAAPPAELDEHGHDPSAYKWVPVLRKPRADGWSPQRQVDFIAALADGGCVQRAAREVGMTAMSCYRLRRAPGAEAFAAAWDAAIAQASNMLVDLAFDRAIHGSDEPVFDKDGHRIGRRMRHNDRLLMFLLRAYQPERFRHAHRSDGAAAEPPPPAALPVAEALRLLEPAPPPTPHLLMPPDELETALLCADLGDGRLPHWYRYKVDQPPVAAPLGEEFERRLEEAKRQGAGLPPLGPDEDGDAYEGDDDAFLE